MNEEAFRKHLKKKGKKANVIDRNVSSVNRFIEFIEKKIDLATKEDIDSYVYEIEKKQKKSAKGPLYVLMNYYEFVENKDMLSYVAKLREERTKKTRRAFPLKEFYNVNMETVGKLASIGIKNVEQMLDAGKTIQQRKELSQQLGIPEKDILELVELSDITRIGYVKSKLARLYHNVGFDTPTKVSKYKAENLYEHFKNYIEKSGWDGMIPNLADLKNNIKSAKTLKEIVEK
ncbi:MAG: DUF4332 domain-containing protein [Candidatus Korarchaeota archaeon]|nr:DUF4332 domain-containing protein [Candidatus Korarchaeota archaeon]NIU83672.1 DUF4332 domain-containing protein [Candidatus Thorarchaeota archaeon]NIW13890.1 DUF4332 domain-containing protein [Candidatus Thorarchaeota archaeon]NIW51996.1 DUF4332 domain-containing protein [Candidatus Korarchaeota archaeon]